MEILRRAQMQAAGPDGTRRSRWAVIRNTYPELKATTIKTWEQWAPLGVGRFSQDSPIVHHIQSGDLDCEVLFMALDRDEDVRKLLSLELTGAWINEGREVPKVILDALTGRVGRFPAKRDGGATWSGIITDTNPPDTESWWYHLAEEDTPEGWEFFKQPGGTSPDAENIENLPDDYYDRVAAGKDPDWTKVYVDGQYGFIVEGRPVFPEFRDRVHTAEEAMPAVDGLGLTIGVDFGLTPAAIFCQRTVFGQWLIIDELVTDNTGTVRFAELLVAYLAQHYPLHKAEVWADPAGTQRAQTDERTALDILREYTGLPCHPAPTNDMTMRREAVANALNRLVDGNPGLLLSPKCATVRKGFTGGYHYKKVRASGSGETFHEKPNKNEFSHPHDALQYAMLGGGEADVVMRRDARRRRQEVADQDYDHMHPFARRKAYRGRQAVAIGE